MAIHYNLHRFGLDEFAVGHLINGDLPTDDEKRWEIVDAPRYRIKKLLDEHLQAQATLRDCRDSGRPFVLFLRSFSAEFVGNRIEGAIGDMFQTDSLRFQEWLSFHLENERIPILKLHGGSDAFLSKMREAGEVGLLSTHSYNWKTVASDLVQAASAIVFLVSHMTAGVVEEFNLIREFRQMHRCLVVLRDPRHTFAPDSEAAKSIRARLADFPNVFELQHVGNGFIKSDPDNLVATLTGLLRNGRTTGPLDQALQAEFTYLEPTFTDSEDFVETETYIWRQLRLLRVMFEDTCWAALKSHGVAFEHFDFPGPWKVAHQVYGLAIAAADFRAIREALSYLRLLYLARNAEYALVFPILAAKYGELAAAIFRSGEPDTESQYASGPDPLKLPAKIEVAIELFQLAEAAGRRRDSDTAIYLYQAAVVCALRTTDCDDRERRWIIANMCRDWASFQGQSAQIEWAVTNCAFAVTLVRDLAAGDPDQYKGDLGLCLNNLGSLHFRRRDFSAANAAFVEALEIRRALPPESDNYLVNLYTSLANLGLLRVDEEKLHSARALYGEALAVCEKRLSSDPTAIVDVTRVLAWTSLCLAKAPDTAHEGLAYAQRAAGNLATVSRVSPESEARLRELVDAALRATGGNLTRLGHSQ
jgi:tetratricopeptide (TPR) repeat protein